jgi:hypothetical protein
MSDPLLALKFPEEYFGFVYQRCGEQGLRRFIEKGPKSNEELKLSIEAMNEVGLTQVAEVLKEYLPDAPSDSQIYWCTYDEKRHVEDEPLEKCYWHRQKGKCICRYDRS